MKFAFDKRQYFCICFEFAIAVGFRNPETFFHTLTRQKRYVTYPSGTAIGLLVAIALPIDVPEENLYFSLNFEANYNLPDNITQYYDSDIARVMHSITRRSTYNLIENQFEKHGFEGEECLARIICEFSANKIENSGVLESLVSVLFRPSKSEYEDIPRRYIEAEKLGSVNENCTRAYTNCDISYLLDDFTLLK